MPGNRADAESPELPELLGGKVVRSELTWLLVGLDKQDTERSPDQRWLTSRLQEA